MLQQENQVPSYQPLKKLCTKQKKPVNIFLLSLGESGARQHLLSVLIYKLLSKELTDRNIPISNCLSFGTDKANVMVGKYQSVYTFLKKDHESIHLPGCTCHLLHHAAEHGSKCFVF